MSDLSIFEEEGKSAGSKRALKYRQKLLSTDKIKYEEMLAKAKDRSMQRRKRKKEAGEDMDKVKQNIRTKKYYYKKKMEDKDFLKKKSIKVKKRQDLFKAVKIIIAVTYIINILYIISIKQNKCLASATSALGEDESFLDISASEISSSVHLIIIVVIMTYIHD